MKNLLCENPAIILNPHAKELILVHGNYYIRNKEYNLTPTLRNRFYYDTPWSLIETKRNNITSNDIDTCYILDKLTGEQIPLYMQVPCNKCTLCKDKKAREWCTRAMCESQTSQGHPLFVTLTYNDIHCPLDGVKKEHIQNFLKRLRVNLNRYLDYDVNLRFFACSEYGSKTKRPHYHLLIWNFPQLDNLTKTLNIIEYSWSFMVTKSEYNKYSSDTKFYDEKNKRYRVRYGFCYVQQAKGGHVKYCMKYMRKDSEIPQGKNDIFYLSSRKRGLGYDWLKKNENQYLNNPSLYDVQFIDIWSSEVYKGTLPTYYKNILYPTISRILPKEIRDNFNLLNLIHNYTKNLYKGRSEYKNRDIYKLLEKFPLQWIELDYIPNYKLHDIKLLLVDYKFDDITKALSDIEQEIEKKLYDYKFDKSFYLESQLRNNQRLNAISVYINSQEEINVNEKSLSLKRKRLRQQVREIF